MPFTRTRNSSKDFSTINAMNNTFSLSRFGRYFRYDFRRWVSTYGPTLLLMSAVPVILYTLTVVYSLLFNQEWGTPGETTRIIVSCIVSAVLLLTYPASVYGYVTEKRAGPAFILLPASVFEKFLSMLLNTIVVVPLSFSLIYLSLDGLICLIDGTCGGTLFSTLIDGVKSLVTFAFASDAPIRVSLVSLYMNSAFSTLFFLLGALIFKKHKILYPILIIVGTQMLLSMLFGAVLSLGFINMDGLADWLEGLEYSYLVNPDFLSWAIPTFNVLATIMDFVVFAAFCAAVYFRIKTIKH